ncbi:MAG: hypothetical protein RL539_780, partial [Pseudomonadota bacterium]
MEKLTLVDLCDTALTIGSFQFAAKSLGELRFIEQLAHLG